MRPAGTRSRTRGQALVETALVLPVLLLILIALFDVGRAIFAYNTATNAAREGARLAIVNQDVAKIQERATGVAVNTPVVSVTVTYYKAGASTTSTADADKCLGTSGSPIVIGCVAVVQFDTSFSAITPLVGTIVGPMTMSARSELPVEFVCPSTTIPDANDCPKQP